MIDPASKKLKVLFVGGFFHSKHMVMGGQLHACNTLIKSKITEKVDFILIDSTMEMLPPPSINRRAYLAIKRVIKFTYELSCKRIDTAFIFTSAGLSFVEKGVMVIIARLFKVRTVLSPRSGLLIDNIDNSWLMCWFVKFVMGRCDVVLCQSNSWKNYFKNLTKLPTSNFIVIKNWLDLKPYMNLSSKKSTSSPIQVLFLGWIEKNKGIYELLSAIQQYKKLQENFNFIICGKGSETDNVRNFIDENNIAHCFDFRGWVTGDEKIAVLHNADILVMPSHREGLPNSLLEAMASGCCVIASSVGAIPDVIDDKKNGFLVEKCNIDQLAKALLDLLESNELRVSMAILGQSTVKEHHDVDIVWRKVCDVLHPSSDAIITKDNVS
jgi:glycosyltransferase involved in cell wall biosynthesis